MFDYDVPSLKPALLLVDAASVPFDGFGAPFTLEVEPGRVLGLVGRPGSGLTRLGLSLIADPSATGMVAALDVRGWLCPVAAWEVGVDPQRLIVVRCPDRLTWPKVAAALVEGFPAVYAEVPAGIGDAVLRRLGALARARRSSLILHPVSGDLPVGLLHLRLESAGVVWEGADRGHGALLTRRLTLRASGKGVRGIEQMVEVADNGTHPVHLVPRLAVAPAGRAAG
jgi:hypothetical protein